MSPGNLSEETLSCLWNKMACVVVVRVLLACACSCDWVAACEGTCVATGVQLVVFEPRHSLSLRTFCSAGIWIVARGTVCFFVRFANWNILLCVSTHLRGNVSAQLGRCVDAKLFSALLRHVVFLGWYEFLLVHRVDVPAFCIFVRWHSVQAFSHDAYGGGASVQRKYSFNLLAHSHRVL
jgi:hypothetical protein